MNSKVSRRRNGSVLSIEEKMRRLSSIDLDTEIIKKPVKKQSLPDIRKKPAKTGKQKKSVIDTKKRKDDISDLLGLNDFSKPPVKIKSELKSKSELKAKSELNGEHSSAKNPDNLFNDLFFATADEDSVSSGYHSTSHPDDQGSYS